MTRATLQRVLPVLMSVGILTWLLSSVDTDALADVLTWRVAAVMTVTLLGYGAVTLWLEVVAISRLLEDVPTHLPRWTTARIKCASYLLGILNYTLGVAAFSLLLHRSAALSLGRAAGIVILVSSADLVVVLVLAGLGTALMQTGTREVAGLLLLGLVGFFGGLAMLRVPGSLGPLERLRQLAIFEGLRTVAPRRLAELFALRIAFAACFVGCCSVAFRVFGVNAPFVEMVSGVLIVALVGAVPVVVAGLGTTQAAFVYLFADYASQETLLAMSLVISFGMLVLRAGMGVVFAREFTREALRDTRGASA